MQFQGSPILKPSRQFGEVVAVKIKDNLQGLTTSFDVVEDMSIWRNKDKTLAALPWQENCETTAEFVRLSNDIPHLHHKVNKGEPLWRECRL